jgi:hypothetical protein
MISGVIGFSGPLFDDDAFGIASAASHLAIDIILPIVASWKTSLSVLEVTPTDVSRKRYATSVFEPFEQIVGFPGRRLDVTRRQGDAVGPQRSVAEVGSGDGVRSHRVIHAQQTDKKTNEANSVLSKGAHRRFFRRKASN